MDAAEKTMLFFANSSREVIPWHGRKLHAGNATCINHRRHHAALVYMTQKQQQPDTQSSSSSSSKNTAGKRIPPPLKQPMPPPPQYSLQARLREETEAPFRKVRMFVYAGSAASAGVGAFISAMRVIAALAGVSGVQPLAETIPNIAIDAGVIGLCVLLLRYENAAGEKRLARMTRGARLAKLRVTADGARGSKALSEFRGKSRMVVLAGRRELIEKGIEDARGIARRVKEASVIVVPVVTDEKGDRSFGNDEWIAYPTVKSEWMKWAEDERQRMDSGAGNDNANGKDDAANKQRFVDDDGDGIMTTIVRIDGKIGARARGPPSFKRLVDEIEKLPKKDRYGQP